MAVKKTIRYQDLDGNLVEQDWYFSLGKTDALEMEIVHHEDVAEYLTQVIKNKDSRKLLEIWKELLFRSVGKREGNMLVKNDAVRDEFRQSGAYEQFFSDLIESDDAGSEFFNSIMPDDVREKAAQQQAREYTPDELLAMSDEEFAKVAGTDESKMSRDHLLVAFRRRSMKGAA